MSHTLFDVGVPKRKRGGSHTHSENGEKRRKKCLVKTDSFRNQLSVK